MGSHVPGTLAQLIFYLPLLFSHCLLSLSFHHSHFVVVKVILRVSKIGSMVIGSRNVHVGPAPMPPVRGAVWASAHV